MPILAIEDGEIKTPERHDRVPLKSTQEQRWSVRCIYTGCDWRVEGLLSEGAVITAGEFHAESTGHPSETEAWIRFKGATIRAKSAVRR